MDVNVDTSSGTTMVALKGDVKGYTALGHSGTSMAPMPSSFGGIDLTLGAEYAVLPILDVGLTLQHIPLLPANLKTGFSMNMEGTILDGTNLRNIGIHMPSANVKFGSDDIWVMRPLKSTLYALYRPLRTDFLVLKPIFGLTALTPAEELYINYGLQTDVNLGRLVTFSYFAGADDGLVRNRLGMNFHWKVLPFYMEFESRAYDWLSSFSLKGTAFTMGFSFAF
jgi:hypothetical protein